MSNSETVGISRFSKKKIVEVGTSDHVAPSGRTPGLPCGRLHETAALWLAWEGEGGGVTHPPQIQTKKKNNKYIRVSGDKENKEKKSQKQRNEGRNERKEEIKERGRKREEEEGNQTSVVQWSDPDRLGTELCYER